MSVIRDPFSTFEVPEGAPVRVEPMGSRGKFWFLPRGADRLWLFKETRPDQFEDWAEVVAFRLASALGLPCAEYQLACYGPRLGVVSPPFNPEGFIPFFGNELLAEQDPEYPVGDRLRFIRTSQHTIDAVANALTSLDMALPVGWAPPAGITRPSEVFGGYLLLDAWIGNTDRHHENWGVLVRETEGERNLTPAFDHLAPTFDHSAALGSHETDETRSKRLSTKDRGFSVEAYVARSGARSALFASPQERKPLSLLDALIAWNERCPAPLWGNRLREITGEVLDSLLGPHTNARISGPGRAFARAMLEANRRRILEVV